MLILRFLYPILIASITYLINCASCDRILGICTAAVRSHWSSCESVFRALSSAQHNVSLHEINLHSTMSNQNLSFSCRSP